MDIPGVPIFGVVLNKYSASIKENLIYDMNLYPKYFTFKYSLLIFNISSLGSNV